MGLEEETLDFKWKLEDYYSILSLTKNSDKTHQYQLFFSEVSEEETKEMGDLVNIVKLLVNMVCWVRTLKCKTSHLIIDLNNILLNEEITPLREDCKTLTIINNVRTILEEANTFQEFEDNIDVFVESTRELQEYLQGICQKVFSAMSIDSECAVYLNANVENEDIKPQSEDGGLIQKGKVIQNRKSVIQQYPSAEKSEELSDFSINFSDELIILKTDNLIVEAKIIVSHREEDQEVSCGQTFNPTESSHCEENKEISLNDTSKEYIFKLLKNFIEGLY